MNNKFHFSQSLKMESWIQQVRMIRRLVEKLEWENERREDYGKDLGQGDFLSFSLIPVTIL